MLGFVIALLAAGQPSDAVEERSRSRAEQETERAWREQAWKKERRSNLELRCLSGGFTASMFGMFGGLALVTGSLPVLAIPHVNDNSTAIYAVAGVGGLGVLTGLVGVFATGIPLHQKKRDFMSRPLPGPVPYTPARRYRGIGLMVSGSVHALAFIGLEASATSSDVTEARGLEASGSEDCELGCIDWGYHIIGASFLVSAAALLGGGFHLYGLDRGAKEHPSVDMRRRSRIHVGVGAGLLAFGAATLLGTQLGAHVGLDPGKAQIAVSSTGWWTAGATGLAGSSLLAFGHGLNRGSRPLGAERPTLSVAPLLDARTAGFSFAGRF